MRYTVQRDEFSKRYLINIISSIIVAIINTVVQLILPRVLSIEEYGIYTYNLNVFVSVVTLANLSCSSALISKFSKRNDERGLLIFYIKFFIIDSIILNIGTIILYKVIGQAHIFIGQTVFMVFLGINASILTYLLQNIISMYDGMAISRFPAFVRISIKVVLGIVVFISFFWGTLNLYVYYLIQSFITFIGIAVLLTVLFVIHKREYPQYVNKGNWYYCKEFYAFCHPLIFATCFSQIMTILKNWMLINYSGETGQAMYGVALQLNVLVTYVFSPYAELMKREFAVIQYNIEKIKYRLLQSFQQVMWITVYFAAFIMVCTEWIVLVIGGDKYLASVPIVRLIMIYTVFQALGQIFGSYLIATEQTKVNARFSQFSQVLGAVGVLLFQIPNFLFPNGLGASGIGWNYAVSNIVYISGVMIYLYKKKNIRINDIFYVQAKAWGICLIVAYMAKTIVEMLVNGWVEGSMIYVKVILAGIVYTGTIVVLIMGFPGLFGLKKQLIDQILNRGKK